MTRRIHVQRKDDGTVIVRLTDTQLADPEILLEQRQELTQLLAGEPASGRFVLDFRCVAFMSSGGLNNLLLFNAQIQRQQGRLILCQLAPNLRRVLEIACLEPQILQVRTTVDEALAALDSTDREPDRTP
ncbi:MAG: STAS domain-containing protein [Pirellulaceae bacterium]|nr:STAS domain-containing protein [Pirellulaceae bacterium]